MLRAMAARVRALGIEPEMEVFDSGDLWFAKQMCDERLIDSPPLFQLCLGIPYGAPANTETMALLSANCHRVQYRLVSGLAACECQWSPKRSC